jgi:hypothetical protein
MNNSWWDGRKDRQLVAACKELHTTVCRLARLIATEGSPEMKQAFRESVPSGVTLRAEAALAAAGEDGEGTKPRRTGVMTLAEAVAVLSQRRHRDCAAWHTIDSSRHQRSQPRTVRHRQARILHSRHQRRNLHGLFESVEP